jgi:hypothetical protein
MMLNQGLTLWPKDNASISSLFDGNKSTNELTLIKQIQLKWFKKDHEALTQLHQYIQHQINTIPQNVDYYINGKSKSTRSWSIPNDINSVDVQKNVNGKIQ